MQIQVALTLFAANFVQWAQEWLATQIMTAPPGAAEFVAVDVGTATDAPPGAQLDVVAEVCDGESRTPTTGTGFVCRLPGGSVYAGLVRDGQVITVAASAVPPGTTAAALVLAFAQQLDALG